MTISSTTPTEIFYPSSDGEPVAETYVHFCALIVTLQVLRQYLLGRQATVLANQFLYYAQGYPKLRVAPDVMVIFDVPPGGRDNYKIWEEGQVPAVVFEITSEGTRQQDLGFKKTLYEQLGVKEYWLFDPNGEWIEEKLRGYRLHREAYELIEDDGRSPVEDDRSQPLQLRLQVEGQLIRFYRETGEKLLSPDEMAEALRAIEEQREQTEERARQAELQVDQLKAQLKALGVDPDSSSEAG